MQASAIAPGRTILSRQKEPAELVANLQFERNSILVTRNWNQLEKYRMKHTDIASTHGMCPGCSKVFFPTTEIKR